MLTNLVVMVTLLATPTPPPPAPAPASALNWTVTGSDVTFEMTARDLRALREGQEVFGLQSRKKPFLDQFTPRKGQRAEDMEDWSAAESYTVLSVVGTWVSYELSEGGYTGGAHSQERTVYVTADVAKASREVSLLDLFLERAAKREEGFLMKDTKAVQAPSVQFSWEPPAPKKR